jgi:hypothetical protein
MSIDGVGRLLTIYKYGKEVVSNYQGSKSRQKKHLGSGQRSYDNIGKDNQEKGSREDNTSV